jgi:peroxiredoxin Q/BCP
MIAEGMPAPRFTLPDETGTPVSLATFRGRPVVLWFYVRDDTPG